MLTKSVEFTNVLKQCSQSAESAYKISKEYKDELDYLINDLKGKLIENIDILLADNDAQHFQFSDELRKLIHNITIKTELCLEDLDMGLKTKRKTLDTFTISLFGKTKTGKSTIREALTSGNGKTIGKGDQRTTRDVYKYNWKGLRLIDVPGIEAFRGEEDTYKAREILDESDMVIFLTTDDSVQPGEFEEMAHLQELNKHFFVVMNVKKNLIDKESDELDYKKISRYLRRPERLFDTDRLNEHRKHIYSYVKKT